MYKGALVYIAAGNVLLPVEKFWISSYFFMET